MMLLTNGMEVYIKDRGVTTKVACVNGVTGISETMAMRDRSTLIDASAVAEPSHAEYGQIDIATRLTYDTSVLLSAQRSKRLVSVYIGGGEATTAYPSSDRSWITFDGYIVGTSTDLQPRSVIPVSFSVNIQTEIRILIKNQRPFSNGLPFSNNEYWR